MSIKIYPDLHHIDEEYIQLIKDSGAQITSIGIQTTNPEALKKINRPTLQHLDRQIQMVLQEFSEVPADLIIGLPGDNIKGLEKSFQDVLSLGFISVNIFRLMVFPGTILSENFPDYFQPEETVLSPQGQLIYSPEFNIRDQQKLSNYIYALEIICWILRTRKIPLTISERLDIFINMVTRLNYDQLIDLFNDISTVQYSSQNPRADRILENIIRIFAENGIQIG